MIESIEYSGQTGHIWQTEQTKHKESAEPTELLGHMDKLPVDWVDLERSKKRILLRKQLKQFSNEIFPILCETAKERLSFYSDVVNEQLINNFEGEKFYQFYNLFCCNSKHKSCLESSIRNTWFDDVTADCLREVDNCFHKKLLLFIFNNLSWKNLEFDGVYDDNIIKSNIKSNIDSLLYSCINSPYFFYEKFSSILPEIINDYFVVHSDNIRRYAENQCNVNPICKRAKENGTFEKLFQDANKKLIVDFVLKELKKDFVGNKESIMFEDLIVNISCYFLHAIILFLSWGGKALNDFSLWISLGIPDENERVYTRAVDIFKESEPFKLNEVFYNRNLKILGNLNNLSIKQYISFVSDHLNIFKISNSDRTHFSDVYEKFKVFSNKIESEYPENKERVFGLWKRLFIARGKELIVDKYNEKNVTMEFEEFKSKVNSLTVSPDGWKVNNLNVNPDKRKISWFPSRKKLDDFKKSFCNAKIKELTNKLDAIVSDNSDLLDSLGLFQLFFFFECFLTFLLNDFSDANKDSDVSNDSDVNEEFKLYLDGELEKIFSKKEETVSTPVTTKPSNEEISRAENLSIKVTTATQTTWKSSDVQVVKHELPAKLIEKLEEYFKWKLVKRSFKKLLDHLSKSWYQYKHSWYDKFWVDDGFYAILDDPKFWFTCIDESVPGTWKPLSKSVVAENPKDELGSHASNTDTPVDKPEILELNRIFKELSNDGLSKEKKADLYVEAFRLFYDFDDEESFKKSVLKYVWSNSLVASWLKFILEWISKWKPNINKKKHGYYAIEIRNAWFRIVLQPQENSNKFLIMYMSDHDTYATDVNNLW